MRIGIGYDIHRLVEDRKLFLGGVEIPYVKGLIGYSDGDVVLHAVCDAILGSLALGDIGRHFPDTDPQYKDISSRRILERVKEIVSAKNFIVSNVDVVIIAEEPKIDPFRDAMVRTISEVLEIKSGTVNIKATTNEGVGAVCRGEAIAAYAVAALEER